MTVTEKRAYKHRHFPNGGPLKRHVKAKGTKRPPNLPVTHPAVANGRTLFPSTVTPPLLAPRLLVDGVNSRKIGKAVTKGRWAGMPIFTLTLEERATCPSSCVEWRTCYGNNMNWARRLIAGPELENGLWIELARKQEKHPAGFVVRLHVLGDFYSAEYANLWANALAAFPALRIFGFTARAPESEIGAVVMAMSLDYADRARIRFSGTDAQGLGAIVIADAADSRHVICPSQTDATDCCGTCGLCWTMNRTIEFLRR